MKTRYHFLIFISFLVLLAGCSFLKGEKEENDLDSSEAWKDKVGEENPEEEAPEDEEPSESKDYRTDLGNLEIYIGGEVIVEEDKVMVFGESNLLPGSRISSHAVSGDWAVISYQDSAEVKQDGSFYFEFPGRQSYTVVTLRLMTGNSEVQELYGENLEKAMGNQIYKTETIGEYRAEYEFVIDPLHDAPPYTIDLETPDWTKVPSDQGDSNVWMEVESTTTHNFLYFEGKTNLEEGAFISSRISDPKNLTSSAWSSATTRVNPDGTFQLRIHYWDLRADMQIHFKFEPAGSSWENIVKAYGEEGEKLAGDLVRTNDDGEKYVKLSVDLAAPDINPPKDVDLTMEEEEIKMQVPDDLLFDFDKSTLKSKAKETLDGIIKELKELPNGTVIQINGHTDSEGEADYNMNLSKERAQAVADYISEHDLDNLSIQIQGFGQTKPIASNEDSDGRQKNRRVEIVINPQ